MLLGTLTVVRLVSALAHKNSFLMAISTLAESPTSQVEEKATGAVDKGQTGPPGFLWITTCILEEKPLSSPSIYRQTRSVVRKVG